jgi:radical SAM superfamily enzyme YgiQ (UPF0313 family)
VNTPSIAVVSAFESKLQPILAASAAAALRTAGARVTAWDADVFAGDFPGADFDLVLISIPAFEGIEAGAKLADLFSTTGARHVLAFGQYAWLNAAALAAVADGVIAVEPEAVASDLVAVARGDVAPVDIGGVITSDRGQARRPKRQAIPEWPVPARELFRPIAEYPGHLSRFGLAGNIEATRGCHHKCSYCAVYAAYGVAAVPIASETVIADAAQLAAQGARHFAYVDAEFFNTRRHALDLMRRIAAELGPVTFELTTRFDHILEFQTEIAEMAGLGLRSITSALEFPSDRLLHVLDKGIDVRGIRKAIQVVRDIGVDLHPTLITFTPWVSLEEIKAVDDFIAETGLTDAVDPTARQTRLLLYKGSPLLKSPWLDGVELIDRGFYYDWRHPDPAVDETWAARRTEAVAQGAERCCVRC